MNKPATDRVFALLERGQSLTAEQISNRFNVSNPYHVVYSLRNRGLNIITTPHTIRGKTVSKYSYIAPRSRKKM